jgi:hypothetical protein
MTAHLDGDELPLKNYTIPRAIAFRDKEIIDAYIGITRFTGYTNISGV